LSDSTDRSEPGGVWAVLKALCHVTESPARLAEAAELIRDGRIDMPELLEQATRHRQLPALGYLLATEDCGGRQVVAPQLRGELLGSLLANRGRVDRLAGIAAEVAARLGAQGITVAVTKGVALEPTVYGGLGVRKMMDADLMIHPRDRERIDEVMSSLGFRIGQYDWQRHRIDDLPATARAVYRLSPDHLPHYLRLEPDRGGTLVVDFANSVTWANSRWQVPMEDVLAERDTVLLLDGRLTAPTLAPPWQFLFTVLHLFRESWFLNSVAAGKDMLSKFSDVIGLWRTHGALLTAEVPAVIRKHGLEQPVAWVLGHTDSVFGTHLVQVLGLGDAARDEWLARGEGPGGRELTWTGTMRERLLCRDRVALFREAR
jgi:hypothetical protein